MDKGIIYIMTTPISGLIKIGKSQSKQWQERMRHLESNGYYNMNGLKRAFAIEVNDYDAKESLIHEVFSRHRIADSELFAVDLELITQLLLSFDGKVIYPENIDKEKQFDDVSKTRTASNRFNFYNKGIKYGETISFHIDPNITATVVGEREVEYQNAIYKLSPLTYKIMEEKNQLNKSGAYQGAYYWDYKGKKLTNIKDIV